MRSSLFFVLLVWLALIAISCEQGSTRAYLSEADLENPQFVGNSTCASCHEVAFENWKNSDHDKAMDHATDSSVLGDFSDKVVNFRGIESRFFKKDGDFYVYTKGPEGKMGEFKIEYTFGHWPLQQYLIPFEKGRLQCLPLAWDSQQNIWYDLVDSVYGGMDIPPNDWLYWTNNGQNWNGMCAECHSTNLQKGYDLETQEFNTTWSEINVNCEACHGPASNHVRWAEMEEGKRQELAYAGFPEKSIDLNTEEMLNQCAFCHARRSSMGDFKHDGSHYLNQFLPQLVDEEHYYFDGQIKSEDYVFTSFTQSRMHTREISCKDCHEPHNLRTKQPGNLLCLQCHKFDIYDTEAHHFHKKTGIGQSAVMTKNGFYDKGDGTQCVDCHMTGAVYMGVDFRRDHNFRVPRPDVSMRVGSPDACTSCHTEMSQKEAFEVLRKWYPDSFQKEQYGDLFFRISIGDETAVAELLPFIADTSKSSMVRASAIEYLSRTNDLEARNEIIKMLKNEDPLVRYAATQYYWGLDAQEDIATMEGSLNDSLKAIRVAAVINLLSQGYSPEDSLRKVLFEKVTQEYLSYLESSGDFAMSRHNLGVYYANKGDTKKAISNLKEAIRIDDQYFPAMLELALLYNRQGNNVLAEKWLLYTLDKDPANFTAIRYMALLKAEVKKYDEALVYFEKLIALDPTNPRNYYNLAFVQIEQGDNAAAEESYVMALYFDPTNRDYLYALGYFYLNSDQKEKGNVVTNKMLELYPQDPATKQLLSLLYSN